MHIIVVNPNTSAWMTDDMAKAAKAYANPGTRITGVTPPWGTPGIYGNFEGFLSAAAVMEAVSTFPEPFDAVVMAGFGEPGREGVRELLNVPVMDITECSALLACTLGSRFGVVTTTKHFVPIIEDIYAVIGLQRRCVSVRATGLGVLDLEKDPKATQELLAEQATKAINEDGAEVIILGCGGMGGFDKELERRIGVPVIDGIVAAVKMAEACYAYGISTSKINSYGSPRKQPIDGWPVKGKR
jgi:allantoin racemase